MIDALAHPSLWRRTVTWLAFIGLLSNVVLPAATVIAVGSVGVGICSAASTGTSPGKAVPGLLVHHCALCAALTALPYGPQAGAPVSVVFIERVRPQLYAISLVASFRHGRVQARAPPIAA